MRLLVLGTPRLFRFFAVAIPWLETQTDRGRDCELFSYTMFGVGPPACTALQMKLKL